MAQFDEATIGRALSRHLDSERLKAVAAVQETTLSASRNGNLGGSTYFIQAAQAVIACFRDAAEKSAVRLAEITQADATSYIELLRAALLAAAPKFAAAYSDGVGNSSIAGYRESLGAEVNREINEAIQGVVEDLSLGLAGGINVDKNKSRIIAIDNRGGHGQFAFDNRHVSQTIVDNSQHGIDAAAIEAVLAALNSALSTAPVTREEADQIADEVVAVQRELMSPKPDVGRLKRMLLRLGQFSEGVASGALGGIAAQVIAIAVGLGV
jgi:hypothetical protein